VRNPSNLRIESVRTRESDSCLEIEALMPGDLQVWMAENLNKNLSVDVLARRAAMSPRNFSRVYRKETGITPAKFAERLRVEAARRQLEQTVKAVKEIAASSGFSSSEIMRRTFLSQLQVTPSAYRLRFQRRSPPGTSRS
jgi:transcriptional regulator GlxA family with amidase domain